MTIKKETKADLLIRIKRLEARERFLEGRSLIDCVIARESERETCAKIVDEFYDIYKAKAKCLHEDNDSAAQCFDMVSEQLKALATIIRYT